MRCDKLILPDVFDSVDSSHHLKPIVVLVEIELDVRLIAEGDDGHSDFAGLNLQLLDEVLHKVQHDFEVDIVD
jgi:hypothetical protein